LEHTGGLTTGGEGGWVPAMPKKKKTSTPASSVEAPPSTTSHSHLSASSSSSSSASSSYEKGRELYADGDFDAAFAHWLPAAEQGDHLAQFELAARYEKGEGVEENAQEAVRLYAKAARMGHTEALCALGRCHESGIGVDVDEEEAVRWYAAAVEQGLRMLEQAFRDACVRNGVSKSNRIALLLSSLFPSPSSADEAYEDTRDTCGHVHHKGHSHGHGEEDDEEEDEEGDEEEDEDEDEDCESEEGYRGKDEEESVRRCSNQKCDSKTDGQERLKLMLCAQCRSASYCSRECQRQDWKQHKGLCRLKSHKN
jgi:TPR repeat protein